MAEDRKILSRDDLVKLISDQISLIAGAIEHIAQNPIYSFETRTLTQAELELITLYRNLLKASHFDPSF